MRVYIGNTGHIKNHKKFKILFWSRELKKQIFTVFPDFFFVKIGGKYGKSVFWTPGTKIKF